MTTLPILSTATGLVYGYEQSEGLAFKGEPVWKARTGAGGTFNNYYRVAFLILNGTLYQLVQGGVVALRNGKQ
jgi:hypothetical protein